MIFTYFIYLILIIGGRFSDTTLYHLFLQHEHLILYIKLQLRYEMMPHLIFLFSPLLLLFIQLSTFLLFIRLYEIDCRGLHFISLNMDIAWQRHYFD